MPLELGPARLGSVIRANVALTAAAGGFTVLTSLTVARLQWLTLAGVAVVLTAVPQWLALRRLHRGDTTQALLIYSIASWAIALLSSFIVTFQWPIQVAVAFLPTVLAATFLPERPITGYVAASAGVAFGVALLGVSQDVTGLSDEIPGWLKNAVQALVFPAFFALVVFAVVQHHRRVSDVLAVQRVAQELAEQRATELASSRRRLVDATDRARRQIERDLHDGAQAHLVGIDLQLTKATSLTDLDATRQAIRDAQRELHRAHGELRELAHGLFPPVLTQHGLVPAIEDAVDRIPTRVRLDIARIGRPAPDIEAAAYFCVLEALQNAMKHSGCEAVTITIRRDGDPDRLRLVVADDGRGAPSPLPAGHGIDNMRDRLGAVGGSVTVEPGDQGGTLVDASIPWRDPPR